MCGQGAAAPCSIVGAGFLYKLEELYKLYKLDELYELDHPIPAFPKGKVKENRPF